MGLSRWWSLLVGMPASAAAALQIGFWVLFFGNGLSNPTLGVAREMVLPWLDAGLPLLVAVWLAISVWLLAAAGRANLRG